MQRTRRKQSEITLTGNRTNSYAYSADGRRLGTAYSRKVGSNYVSEYRNYCGNLVVKNGLPNMFLFPGGYYSFNSSGVLDGCHYYIQDYQGSNRMVVNKTGTVEQITHYYPYGGVIGGIGKSPDLQKYKFEGKEFDRTYGLDWYDIEARQYDPVVPSWHKVDPLAEKYYWISPYAYCANNPIMNVDLYGDSIIVDKFGENLEIRGSDKNVYMRADDVFKPIGEIGKTINIDEIAKNVFNRNSLIAEKLRNPITFYNKVKTNGEWDLKNKDNTIWQYAREHNTDFQYGKDKLGAADVGNYNFGVVSKAFGIPEQVALRGAGMYQIISGTSNPKWQIGFLMNVSSLTPSGIVSTSRDIQIVPPFGDDPIDQYWIKQGYKY